VTSGQCSTVKLSASYIFRISADCISVDSRNFVAIFVNLISLDYVTAAPPVHVNLWKVGANLAGRQSLGKWILSPYKRRCRK